MRVVSSQVRAVFLGACCLLISAGAAPARASPARPILTVDGAGTQSLDSPEPDAGAATWWISSRGVNPAAEVEALNTAPPRAEDSLRPPFDSPPPGYVPVRVPLNIIGLGLVQHGSGRTVWYRRALFFPSRLPTRLSIRLGEISDIDRAYFNGQQIGGVGDFSSRAFQAYDRHRIYDIPMHLVQPGRINLVHVEVRGSFADFLGIFRDRTEIGPSPDIWRAFYYENMVPLMALSFYLAAGLYFLFLFVRRRREEENLYFGLFVVCLVVYQFLRTQLKYDLGLSFLTMKRTEYVVLQLIVPLFFLFIRAYYPAKTERRRFWHWHGFVLHSLIAAVAVAVLIAPEPTTWWTLNKFVTQPTWILYIGSAVWILGQEARRGQADARIMGATLAVLVVCAGIDTLTSRGYWNLPQLVPWSFVVFVLGFAVILANRFVRLNNETDRLNIELDGQARSFHRFVPTQFLEILGKDDLKQVRLGDSAHLRMTVLFSDLRSFTTLSESMSPHDNFNFLNSYLKRMEPAIKKHGGFVDKFIGDAIMALFPEPRDGPVTSAESAVAAAVEMRRGLLEYNRHRATMSYAPIDVGIGINSGDLMLGTVGSATRLDTTVIGDSVNMASRIEALTPVYRVGILISDATQAALPPDRFLVREVDTIVVRGRTDPVLVYEVFDADEDEQRGHKLESGERLQGAIGLYKAGEFSAALKMFEALMAANPNDGLFAMYARRCRKLIATPPPQSWRGAVRLRRK